jgi:hypothetical protein
MFVKGGETATEGRLLVVGQPALPFGRISFGDSKADYNYYVRSEQSAPRLHRNTLYKDISGDKE